MNSGTLAALGAFTLWGLMPLYLKMLAPASATEIMAHRILWSVLFVALLLLCKRQWQWLGQLRKSPKLIGVAFSCAVLISINWLLYVWAATSGFIIEASLGYFINPLVNVLLGMLFLGERLRPIQRLALLMAISGVFYMTLAYGKPPWIALVLAFSFGFYGLIRKWSPLGSIEGLLLETLIVASPALAYLLYLTNAGQSHFNQGVVSLDLLFIGTGVITAVPLILFAYSARRITLIQLGLMQYIAPTLQVLIGVWLYHEPFSGPRVVGFGLIWAALALYSIEGIYRRRGDFSQKLL